MHCNALLLLADLSAKQDQQGETTGGSTDRYGCPGVPGGEVNGAKALTILQDEGLIVGSHGEGYFVKH